MKKLLIIILLILGIGGIYCFYPHNVEHAILLESTDKLSTVYLKGEKVKLTIPKVNYPINTVFNYKYNLFKIYGLTTVKALTNRVMVKEKKSYEIESQGNISIYKNASFYRFNKTKLEPCTSNDLIIGKNNIQSFLNSSGSLMTFIISPIDYTNTRVGLTTNNFTSLYHEKLQLMSSSKLKLYSLVKKTSEEVPANTLIEIYTTSKGMFALINGKTTLYLDRLYLTGGLIKILTLKRGSPEYIPEYNGTLEFNFSTKGISVINELGVEDYLTKIVQSEMPSSSGVEALKCQAVVSRTSIILDMLSNKFANLGFYVDDSTKGQLYNNSLVDSLSTTAINSTKGLIMAFNNNPIDSKFFSTSGGTGVRYEDVWYKPSESIDLKPYFRTVNFVSSIVTTLPKDEPTWLSFYKNTNITSIDSSSPYYRWNIKVSSQQLSKSLNAILPTIYKENKDYILLTKKNNLIYALPKLDELKDIQVAKRSPGGNVMSLMLIFQNIDILIQGDSTISAVLNFKKEYTGSDTSLIRLKSSTIPNPSILPSRFFAIEKTGDSYTLYGGGYGHGVGMSQYGAMNLSKNGWDFKKILNIYYKNITYIKVS